MIWHGELFEHILVRCFCPILFYLKEYQGIKFNSKNRLRGQGILAIIKCPGDVEYTGCAFWHWSLANGITICSDRLRQFSFEVGSLWTVGFTGAGHWKNLLQSKPSRIFASKKNNGWPCLVSELALTVWPFVSFSCVMSLMSQVPYGPHQSSVFVSSY